MTQTILFLSAPVIFGGLCLLLGESIQWLKKNFVEKDRERSVVILQRGRK